MLNTFRRVSDDYTNPDAEDYWTDQDDTGSASALLRAEGSRGREDGSASSLLLLAGLIPIAFVVWFLAHVAGAVAGVTDGQPELVSGLAAYSVSTVGGVQ